MRRLRVPLAILVLGGLWFGTASARQTAPQLGGASGSRTGFQVVARGRSSQTRGIPPAQIAGMDNNGEILVACVEPRTLDQLRAAGIRFVRSQVELLTDWGFLTFDQRNGTYTSTVHVYGPEQAAAIRVLVAAGAARVVNALGSDLAALRAHLATLGRERAMFAVLHVYLLHGYSMAQFSEEIYTRPELSVEHPFWNGFAWIIQPSREFDLAPSQMALEGIGRFCRLSGRHVSGPSMPQWMALLKDAGADLRIDDPALRKDFAAFALADADGRLTIPVFDGAWPSRLETMGAAVYGETKTIAGSAEMRRLLQMGTRAQAEMFVHYEMRYAVLRQLLDSGGLVAPVALDGSAQSSPAEAGNLAFLIRAAKGAQ